MTILSPALITDNSCCNWASALVAPLDTDTICGERELISHHFAGKCNCKYKLRAVNHISKYFYLSLYLIWCLAQWLSQDCSFNTYVGYIDVIMEFCALDATVGISFSVCTVLFSAATVRDLDVYAMGCSF